MAKTLQTKSKATANKPAGWQFPFTRRHYMLFAAGLGVIVLGFLLMSTAITDDPVKYQTAWNNTLAVSVAPVVLVIGYCVIIPFALMAGGKSDETAE